TQTTGETPTSERSDPAYGECSIRLHNCGTNYTPQTIRSNGPRRATGGPRCRLTQISQSNWFTQFGKCISKPLIGRANTFLSLPPTSSPINRSFKRSLKHHSAESTCGSWCPRNPTTSWPTG